MRHVVISDRMSRITDRDLWQAMDPRQAGEDPAVLADARRLGLAGKKAFACSALRRYFTAALTTHWEAVRRQYADPVSMDDVRKALATPAWQTGSGQPVALDQVKNWHDTRFAGDQRFGWLQPIVAQLVTTADPACRRYLIETCIRYYQVRNTYHPPRGREHPVYAALPGRFHMDIFMPVFVAVILQPGPCPPEFMEAMLKMFLGLGRFLVVWTRPFRVHNVHTAGCIALFTVARLMPGFRESQRWDRQATSYLHRTLKEGFFSDGCHKERVWGYGFYALENLQHAYELAQHIGGLGRVNQDYLARLRRTYRWYAKTLGPGELKPSYGDCELCRMTQILDYGARIRPPQANRYFNVDRTRSYLFRSSGFAVLRNGDARRSSYLNINFGRFFGWHSHHDMLAMNFWAFNEPLIEECGRFNDYGEPLDILFRAPESHNQVLIDGFFYDARGKRSRDVVWHSDDQMDYFSAYHQAYRWLPNKAGCAYVPSMDARVRRTIVFIKSRGYAVVLDSVRDEDERYSTFNRAVTAHWHSPFEFQRVGPTQVKTQKERGAGCLLALARPTGLKPFLIEPDYIGEDGPRGYEYPERYHLRARRWMPHNHQGATGFITLLYPFERSCPEVSVETLDLQGGAPFQAEALAIRTPQGRDLVILNPERLPDIRFAGHTVRSRAMVKLSRTGSPAAYLKC